MEAIPAIDKFFNLEEALKDYGFKIDEKDDGTIIAYDIYSFEHKGNIQIRVYQNGCFKGRRLMCQVTVSRIEKGSPEDETLFLGVAPTNQHDFDMLMQLLFPSDAFMDRLDKNMDEK